MNKTVFCLLAASLLLLPITALETDGEEYGIETCTNIIDPIKDGSHVSSASEIQPSTLNNDSKTPGDDISSQNEENGGIPAIFYVLSIATIIFAIALVYYLVKVRNK